MCQKISFTRQKIEDSVFIKKIREEKFTYELKKKSYTAIMNDFI